MQKILKSKRWRPHFLVETWERIDLYNSQAKFIEYDANRKSKVPGTSVRDREKKIGARTLMAFEKGAGKSFYKLCWLFWRPGKEWMPMAAFGCWVYYVSADGILNYLSRKSTFVVVLLGRLGSRKVRRLCFITSSITSKLWIWKGVLALLPFLKQMALNFLLLPRMFGMRLGDDWRWILRCP